LESLRLFAAPKRLRRGRHGTVAGEVLAGRHRRDQDPDTSRAHGVAVDGKTGEKHEIPVPVFLICGPSFFFICGDFFELATYVCTYGRRPAARLATDIGLLDVSLSCRL
jgi:hypothetical protein